MAWICNEHGEGVNSSCCTVCLHQEIEQLNTIVNAIPTPALLRLLVKWINCPRMKVAFPEMDWDDNEVQDELLALADVMEGNQ